MRIPLFRIVETVIDEDSNHILYFPTKTTAERYQQENKKNSNLEIGKWEKVQIESKQLLCCLLSEKNERVKLSNFLESCVERGYLGQL